MRKFCLKCAYIEENLQKLSSDECQEKLQLEPSQLREELRQVIQLSKKHAQDIIQNKLKDYQPFVNILEQNKVIPLFHIQLACASILTAILKMDKQLEYEDQLIIVKNLCTNFTDITGLDALTENLNFYQDIQKEIKVSQETFQVIGAWPVLSSLNLSKNLNGYSDLLNMGQATQNMLLDFGIFISEFSDQLLFLIEGKKVN